MLRRAKLVVPRLHTEYVLPHCNLSAIYYNCTINMTTDYVFMSLICVKRFVDIRLLLVNYYNLNEHIAGIVGIIYFRGNVSVRLDVLLQ